MTVTRPVIIFDTDIGNDIDDALALVMLHSYVDMGFIDFAAVTISKDNKWAAVYTDIVNRFYGHPDIPIGIVRDGKTEDTGPFIKTVSEKMGKDFSSLTDIEDAVTLQRKILSNRLTSLWFLLLLVFQQILPGFYSLNPMTFPR